MSEISIGELVGSVSLNDQFSGPVNNVAEGLGVKLGKSLEAVTAFAGLASGAITATAAAVATLGTRGSEIADVQGAFGALAARAGEASDVMLGALQRGTLGTISNFDLMKEANKALGSGLVTSAKDMGTLAAGAKLLADRTGGDTAQAFDKLTDAMASGKTASLKQLGLFVDTQAAAESYARSIGKTSSDLTQHEKATAISHAAIAALRGEIEAAGPAQADFADRIAQGKTAVTNLVDSFSVAIATSPVLAEGMDALTKAIQDAFGSNQQQIVQTLIGYVNQFGIFLVDVVSAGVSGAQFLANAWSGLKVIFNEFMALFVGQAGLVIQGVQAIVDALQPVQDLAKSMGFARDGIDEAFEGIKRAVGDAGQTVEAMRQSFKDQSAEALDNAAAQNAAFETVKTTLAVLEGKMRDVASAGTEAQAGASAAAAGVKQLGEASSLTEKELQRLNEEQRKAGEEWAAVNAAIADKFQEFQDRLTLANTTGVERRVAEMLIAQQKELESLATVQAVNEDHYRRLVELSTAYWKTQIEQATGVSASVAERAEEAGFRSRAALQQTADNAAKLYEDMKNSGLFTTEELKKAWEAAEQKKREASEETRKFTVERFGMIASSVSGILRSIFGKNKAAAIAAAVIDTAAAIVKTLASMPFPWSLIPAAAVAAAGYAQIQQIRNTEPEGFATGTPDMAFMDFGRATAVPLHGDEAVVNRAQGATLADLVVDAVHLREDRVVRQLERMEEAQRERDRALPLLWRDMAAFARA